MTSECAYAYDVDEQVLKRVWDGDDTDPQTGAFVSETTYHYDLRGRMSKVEIDADGDGQIDTVTEYRYNPNGIRVKQTVTENPGTAEEEVSVHEYVIGFANNSPRLPRRSLGSAWSPKCSPSQQW